MRCLLSALLCILLGFGAEAKIRNRKVKEAPRTCAVMKEDDYLSRDDKKVLGTLRNSLLIETDDQTITLVKDKGEKICQWSLAEWADIQTSNRLPDLGTFKFYIDEYKDVIYPYVQKQDKSYFQMRIPASTCDLSDQVTKEKLEFPKCDRPKKAKSRSRKKSVAKS